MENYDPKCQVCGFSEGDPNEILICDRCYHDVHMKCVDVDSVPEGDFYCPQVCQNSNFFF